MTKIPLQKDFTAREKEAIRRFLVRMIESAASGEAKAVEALKFSNQAFLSNQRLYWRNVGAGFKWARGLLKDSKPKSKFND